MINDIKDGVTNAIYSEFGSGYKIYTEDISQGLTEPSFFVAILEPFRTQLLNCRQKLTVPVDVHYFPSTKNKNREIADVIERLFEALRFIDLANNDKLGAFDMRAGIVENVLHFFAEYRPIIIYQPDSDVENMDDLTLETEVDE